MPKMLNQIKRISLNELRSIILVILESLASGFYYSWWFQSGRLTGWLAVGFIIAVLYVLIQIFDNWIVSLVPYCSAKIPSLPAKNFTGDIFATAYKEDHALIERTLTAACAIQGNQKTWLLDDVNDPQLATLAKSLGAGYLTHTDRKDAKAGNVNATLAQTHGDILAIFDIGPVPSSDFLKHSLEPFNDPTVGFAQVMPTFSNADANWITRASADISLGFYNPTAKGMDGLNSITKMGNSSLIRWEALESINEYRLGLAEDIATSVTLHAASWHSDYVAEPLAPRLATPDLAAWFTPQLKWARDVFEILLADYHRLFTRLNWGQQLSYAVRMTKYG
jgi:cellulose synthase (UDP-forming)